MPDVDVCVVGAGFAGLTAALRVKQAGHSVALLEARDRVGGRTFTEMRDDGTWIDRGGAWVGPTQDRIFKQYHDGEPTGRRRPTLEMPSCPTVCAAWSTSFPHMTSTHGTR